MDISQNNWNESDDNNATASPDGAPEGMPPSGVNNTMRAMMGAIKRWYDQTVPATTTGSATAYLLSYAVVPTAVADGMTFLVRFDKTCGSAPTLNVNSLGAKQIYGWYTAAAAWAPVNAGDIVAGQKLRLTYDLTSGNFHVVQPLNVVQYNANVTVPTGATMGFRGSTAQVPAGWVLERGNSIGDASSGATERANADTQALFTLFWANTNYGLQNSLGATVARGATAAADYAAHCRLVLPDMTNKFRRADNSGTAVGAAGGANPSPLSVNVNVTTTGSGPIFNKGGGYSYGGSFDVVQAPQTVTVSSTGTGTGSTSTPSLPPYVTELSMIKL